MSIYIFQLDVFVEFKEVLNLNSRIFVLEKLLFNTHALSLN